MKCLPLPTSDGSERCYLGSKSILSSIAEKSCSNVGDAIFKDACVFNVIAVGEIKLVFSELLNV